MYAVQHKSWYSGRWITHVIKTNKRVADEVAERVRRNKTFGNDAVRCIKITPSYIKKNMI